MNPFEGRDDKEINIEDLLKAQYVTRWHTVATNRSQTVAEHAYSVATIAGYLCYHIHGPEFVPEVMVLGLFHDATETRTGDIPPASKAFINAAHLYNGGTSESLLGGIDDVLMPGVPAVGIEAMIVGLADKIDAACWIRHHAVGGHSLEVAEGCWNTMEREVQRLVEHTGDGGIINSVNKLLGAMACPPLK